MTEPVKTAIQTRRRCTLIAMILVIVSASRALTSEPVPTNSGGLKAVSVFQCDFENDSDLNFDAFPDGWTRKNGSDFPHYVKTAIAADESGNRALRIDLDGGRAILSSPRIAVDSRYSFHLNARLRTSKLKHDSAGLELTFYDAEMKPLETLESQRLRGTNDWTEVSIGPAAPQDSAAAWAVVSLVTYLGEREDLVGSISFDDLLMMRLPRIMLHGGGLKNLYFTGERVEFTAVVSGVSKSARNLRFALHDAEDHLILESLRPIDTGNESGATSELAGTAKWSPGELSPGFYRLRVAMTGDEASRLEHSITLMVVEPGKQPIGGEFGFTLPLGEKPLDFGPMAAVLAQCGVNWVKFPVWGGDDHDARFDRIARFAERLSLNRIEMIGMLAPTTSAENDDAGDPTAGEVASVFNEPDHWRPAIDPVMTRLSLKVHWWQLGHDDDLSYLGHPDPAVKLREVKKYLERYGQAVRIGFPWRMLSAAPVDAKAPWEFLSLNDTPALTAEEIRNQAGDAQATSLHKKWMVLRPLPRGEYAEPERRRDLVKRMVSAKIAGVDTSFLPNPFDDREGLFRADGSPDELFAPWRTAALAISGKSYLGTLTLPNGSENHIFAEGSEAVMVVWNDRPTNEHAFLGEAIRRTDIWGRSEKITNTELENGATQQDFEVGPDPIFLHGVNPHVAKWCMAFDFENPQLQSLFGRDQLVGYKLRNDFPKGVGGQISFHAPQLWDVPPRPLRFRLQAGEERTESFPLRLKPEADGGEQKIRVDFDITADKVYRFSLQRSVVVGLRDIEVALETRMNDQGELLVDAHILNQTGKLVSFQCMLFAPDRRRERRQVINLGRERTTITFALENGEELLGRKIWLKLEELGGSRVLNQNVTANK